MTNALNIKTINKSGVLRKITDYLSKEGVNIEYTHTYSDSNQKAHMYIEIEEIGHIGIILKELEKFPEVKEINLAHSMDHVWGKRIIIMGGGAQVSQVALGAITEADRHNIRGERISVDTIPLAGEEKLAEAVRAVGSLPRVKVLVLAGSLMGGSIVDAMNEIRDIYGVKIISLNMVGSVRKHADLVVTDPVQAGVMAVMTVASTAKFDIERVKEPL